MDLAVCNKECKLDREWGFCLGCGRDTAELKAWTKMDERQQQLVASTAKARLERRQLYLQAKGVK